MCIRDRGREGSGQFIGLLPAHADGQAALRVSVHQQDLLALHRQTDAQIFTGRGPVSYTHLDVYKRQSRTRPSRSSLSAT